MEYILLVLLVMLVEPGISSPSPKLTMGTENNPIPATGWITKKPGDSLSLTCSGATKIRWNYPDHSTERAPHDIESRKHIEYQAGGHVSTFTVATLQYKDTGYYSCFYQGDSQGSVKYHTQSLYVFVEDNDRLFVTPDPDGAVVTAYPGERVNIPCRPTSPDVNVTLWSGHHPGGRKCEDDKFLVPGGDYSMYAGITITPDALQAKQPYFTVQCKGEKLQENGVNTMWCLDVWVVYNDRVKWPRYD